MSPSEKGACDIRKGGRGDVDDTHEAMPVMLVSLWSTAGRPTKRSARRFNTRTKHLSYPRYHLVAQDHQQRGRSNVLRRRIALCAWLHSGFGASRQLSYLARVDLSPLPARAGLESRSSSRVLQCDLHQPSTNGKAGGKQPSGNRAVRSPSFSLCAASRKAARNQVYGKRR